MRSARVSFIAAVGALAVATSVSSGAAQNPALERILAAERGDTPEVTALVAGKDPNARDKIHQRTALMWSIFRNDYKAFDRFIATPGADVNAKDDRGETALLHAAQFVMKFETTPMVEALIANGADVTGPTETGGLTPLMHAANGNAPGAALAILTKLDPKQLELRNSEGRTALSIGAAVGATEVVRLLLEKGAKLEGTDDEGKTALLHAAGHQFPGSLATLALLLEKGADPNARDQAGNTPLSEARKYGPPGAVEALQRAGAK